ncbi:MAG TPA: CopD family protein [Dongiaceae bacterium]|jgi:putative copper resistance protein D|nr:CopD family protein [Dongiaceae bacterium]
MALLIDVFGFLSVLLAGLTRTAQCVVLGTALFSVLIAPLGLELDGPEAALLKQRLLRCGTLTTAGLFFLVCIGLILHFALLHGSLELPVLDSLTDNFSVMWGLRFAFTFMLMLRFMRGKMDVWLVVLALGDLACGVGISHAAARLDERSLLLVITALHHLGAGMWIGGLPAFLIALNSVVDGGVRAAIGRRYSHLSIVSVLAIAGSGIAMAVLYGGSPQALYGTAYGAMMGTKVILFGSLLMLGLGNFLMVRRLAHDPALPYLRIKRFVEVELGIGIAIFFGAASMTSLPPAIDLVDGRASFAEITERMTPIWPSLKSPTIDDLAIYVTQRKLDTEAAARGTAAASAYEPGTGIAAPRNAADIKWSEYNHHWSGIIVMLIGFLAFLDRALGLRWARHWPLAYLLLAVFLFIRSEPEFWPIGTLSFAQSIRDPEFLQHKVFITLISAFALFEWAVRQQWLTRPWASYVFPFCCAGAGTFLLAHQHSLANVKDLLLIEYTHIPLAVFGIWAGWARWLDLRMDGRVRVWAGRAWPVLFFLVGVSLFVYREI